ncbi:MAG TPA: cyclopropane-fatty-acyl-phospholipid synthase family protein [Ilumatobacter sp.]|nr:cyclopropane-fatty-acyl-phospholipid synthase family protein [Ilumatobacter sp.]
MATVRSDRLLVHADRRVATGSGPVDRVAAVAGRAALRRARHERLTVHDRVPGRPTTIRTYGADDESTVEIAATVTVRDERAYAAFMREGSIGFGRGYIEGWWTSDDPVAAVRFAIRNLRGLDRFRDRLHRATGWATDPIRSVFPHDTPERNREDIGAHYDIGNDFFELFLDETMTYSSAVFPTSDASLVEASRHKMDLLLDRLDLHDGHHLLEIGTGWGGMAIRAAGERGARVTTTTISSEQLAEARRRVEAAGLTDRVTVLDDDWRDLTGTYDRLVSVEMIEAVDWRDYDAFFRQIEQRLVPGGRAALQAICLPDERWGRAKNTEDFIRRFVFPNGFLPSVAAIEASVRRATSMRVADVTDLTPHYAETLRRWRETFDARIDEVAALGLDERFQRLWRCYFAYCEGGFREHHVRVVQLTLES